MSREPLRHPIFSRQPGSMVDVLRYHAALTQDHRAFVYLADGETESEILTFGELDQRARAVGAFLQQQKLSGKRVVLVYAPGLEFIASLFGCLYAGAVAVPTYPPDPMRLARTLPKFLAICRDSRPDAVLTSTSVLPFAEALAADAPDVRALPWHATDALPLEYASRWQAPHFSTDSLAFLQYTSGSTQRPRGVRISHSNLLANQRMILDGLARPVGTVAVSWLPFYHDMGLIGMVMHLVYLGGTSVLMSPVAFLKKPLRWLQAISHYRANGSGSPNFGYNLCVRKISAEQRAQLDLSCWEMAFNGAEPVRSDTLERFADYFEPAGFRREAFYPCYGLAEATLFVAGGKQGQAPKVLHVDGETLKRDTAVEVTRHTSNAVPLVSCGYPRMGLDLVIVDPDSFSACNPGEVGEIWIRGDNVSDGYWDLPDETMKTFRAFLAGTGEGPYLRTGDLGFVREDGELFITGRLVDLIIIRGRNHYPQEIERTAEESHPSIRPGCSAAFTVEEDDEERLIVALEVERRRGRERRKGDTAAFAMRRRIRERRQEPLLDGADPTTPLEVEVNEVVACVRQAIAEEHGLNAYHVEVLKAGTIPKTTSGKIQRFMCRQAYLNGTLEKFHEG